MEITQDTDRVRAEWWHGDEDGLEPADRTVGLEVERDDAGAGRVAIHTMIDGTGSHASYYLDRESAIEFAAKILNSVRLP